MQSFNNMLILFKCQTHCLHAHGNYSDPVEAQTLFWRRGPGLTICIYMLYVYIYIYIGVTSIEGVERLFREGRQH